MERSKIIIKTIKENLFCDIIVFIPLFYSFSILDHPNNALDYIIVSIIFFKIYTLKKIWMRVKEELTFSD